MAFFLIVAYVLLILCNFLLAYSGKKNWIIAYITFGIILFVFFVNGEDFIRQIYDLSNYRAQYNYYDPFLDPTFSSYYLFFIVMKLGQSSGMDFIDWWHCLMIFSNIIIICALKIHKFNPHWFLFFYTIYYLFVLYTGLKFYLGFSVFLLGMGFLLKGGRYNKCAFGIATCIAGGFHVMYYLFLIFLFVNTSKSLEDCKNNLVKSICFIGVILSIVVRFTGTANRLIGGMASVFDNEKFNSYIELSTNGGFYIAIIMQLLSMYCAYKYMRSMQEYYPLEYQIQGETLFFINYLQVLFYPFFMISTTFMRLLTVSSFVTITACGKEAEKLFLGTRQQLIFYSLLVIFGFYIRQFIIGDLWETSVLPFFLP